MKNIYEVYLYNDKPINTGCYAGSEIGTVSGWSIEYIECTREALTSYPLFDCIISINDYPMTYTGTAIIEWKGV